MTFPPEVWSGVLRRLEQKLPAFTYEAWVAPLCVGDAGIDRVLVLCPSPFHRDRVRNSLRQPISDAIHDETGRRPALDFDVATRRAIAPARDEAPGPTPAPSSPPTSGSSPPAAPLIALPARRTPEAFNGSLAAALSDTTSNLAVTAPTAETHTGRTAGGEAEATRADLGATGRKADRSLQHASARPAMRRATPTSRGAPISVRGQTSDLQQSELPYSFDNFVVGPCNALAREAAFAVTGSQQTALRQLYLASPPGLGKTHLARAVATEVARTSRRPLRYANAEAFTSEFVSALRNKRTPEFKRRYRLERGGLLVLEDVQFLAAKRATQLEFFHSVQHVLDAGGRVLLTGDRMPQEMGDLDERLREQLADGFVAALEPPDQIVRRRILRMKAAHGAIALPEDCLDLLVESVCGNVRELEGVLMQVVTTATLLKRPIDLELTKRAIAQKIQPIAPRARRPQVGDVLAVVATFFQTTSDQLAARSRKRAVLVPRQLAMYLCHRHTDAPLAEIGRALGRDHPSVRNAIKKVEREMLENPKLRYQLEALTTRIQERLA